MVPRQGKIEWFGGSQDAYDVFHIILDLAHVWDDIVDNDKPQAVTEFSVNHAFLSCLVYLQVSPFYRSIQQQILPMWITVVSGYEAANLFERNNDEHGIEIAHNLRYAAGHIIAYMIHVCVGPDKAREYVPDMWKVLVFERYEKYRKEHLNA